MSFVNWMDVLLSVQNPLLPSAAAMQMYLMAAWFTLELWCVVWAIRRVVPRFDQRNNVWAYGALFVALLYFNLSPDGKSPAYWLGLAFNAPSTVSLLLCGLLWDRPAANTSPANPSPLNLWSQRLRFVWAAGGVALGYVLLLDLLALLPVQLYAWGFSPLALLVLMAVSLVPCVVLKPWERGNRWACLLPLSLLWFVATRLPTGNVWDVVLDPLLWVALHVYLVITVQRKKRLSAHP